MPYWNGDSSMVFNVFAHAMVLFGGWIVAAYVTAVACRLYRLVRS